MTTLLLIRHGQTTSNVMGALDTAVPGADLTHLGQRQAQDLVHRLEGVSVDRIATSLQVRTQQTAAPLVTARGIQPLHHAGFGEISAGKLEMMATHEAADLYIHAAYSWARGDLDVQIPGGEAGTDVLARFEEALCATLAGLDENATVAVVAHGAILRLWVTSQTDGITPEQVHDRPLRNTTVLRIEGRPGSWHFMSWDEPRILDEHSPDPTASGDDAAE